ncbi:MAG: hypothetical protein LBQ58_09805, partial [Synergistaceae bacterium]|nr:hypothetical protein [Synergistaceae bacterium]
MRIERKRIAVSICLAVLIIAMNLIVCATPSFAGVGNQYLQDNLQLYPALVENGVTQPIFDADQVIIEQVWIESPTDTDRDGKRDLLALRIKRPLETSGDNALKVPVIAEVSPYYDGPLPPESTPYYVDVDEDYLGEDNPSTLYKEYEDVRYTGHTYKELLDADFKPDWLPQERLSLGQSRDGTPISTWYTDWYTYFIPRGYAVVSFHMFGSYRA